MYKVVFILISILILTTGLQISTLKSLGISPSFAFLSFFLLIVTSLKYYFKNDTTDIFLYLLIFWVSIKFFLIGGSYAIDLLKALILSLIFKKFVMSVTYANFRRVDWLLYTSGALGLIGFMQLFSLSIVNDIRPLMNSDFLGSGGFSVFAILRPNFGLGNSLNAGLFFILNIFLASIMFTICNKRVYHILILLFIGCIILTLSRTALLQLIILIPTLISTLGYSLIAAGSIVIIVVTHKYINLLFLRVSGGEYTVGSFQERIQAIESFIDSIKFQENFLGTLSTDYYKITDGLLMNVYQSVGIIFTIVYLVGVFRFHTLALRRNIIFIALIIVSIIFTNSFYAYYNLFLLMIILRMIDIKTNFSQ